VIPVFVAARKLLFGGIAGKVLGIARELLSAALFGTGPIAVAYRLAQAAFLIPLHGFLSEAFTAGFTPAYARLRDASRDESRALFTAMHAIAVAVSIAVGVLLALLARAWVGLLAPGFDPSTMAMTVHMVTLLACAMPFYALTSLYAAAEIAVGRAQMAAARASVQNVGLIAGALAAWWSKNPVWIAGGFVAAYVVLAAWGLRNALAQGFRPWLQRSELPLAAAALAGVWRAVRVLLLVPVLLQIHLIVERRIASLVSPETVAALDYARFLSDSAVLLLSMPLGVAGLGAMARLNEAQFRDLAYRSLRMLLYAGMPLSLVMAVHGEAIVQLVFARGAFGADSVAATATILQWLAIGLWARLIGFAGAKFLSARSRNISVIGSYVAAVGCNVAVNSLLYPVLGAAALGLGAAVNSLVFGLLILRALGQFGRLRMDLMTLAALAGAYVAFWAAAPASVATAGSLALAVFAAYWSAAALLVPRCRQVIYDVWLAFRTA
jgi:putative peptidoglycan lipid II flippase